MALKRITLERVRPATPDLKLEIHPQGAKENDMALFAIIKQPGENAEKLEPAIMRAYADSVYPLGNGAWIISDATTAKNVSDKLSITQGQNGSAVIIEIASYYGRGNPAIWSWIAARWGGGRPNVV